MGMGGGDRPGGGMTSRAMCNSVGCVFVFVVDSFLGAI